MNNIIANLVAISIACFACGFVAVHSDAPDNIKTAAILILVYLGWSISLIKK